MERLIVFKKEDLNTRYPVGRNISGYLEPAKYIAEFLDKEYPGPINLVATGSSGAILAALIVSNLKTPDNLIFYVKKDKENSHQDLGTEVEKLGGKNDRMTFLVDDFINTGATLERCLSFIQKASILSYGLILFDKVFENELNNLSIRPVELLCLTGLMSSNTNSFSFNEETEEGFENKITINMEDNS